MPAPPLLQLSALQLGRRVRRGELSAVDVLDAHIQRIREINPICNALVADRFSAARADAQAVDRRTAAGEAVGPLAGVPFTVKEMIAAAGMPHTFGCTNRAGRSSSSDATVVARLRAAGAILLGVTNVPEWGMWPETYNRVYGRTRNPHDPRRTPGGSSGGEAAIVAAGGSAFGVGTDIGGSVRMPAAFCGVYAHKPSHGLLPLTGAFPVYAGSDGDMRAPYLTIGPFARSVADLYTLLCVMKGRDAIDPNARELYLGAYDDVSWRGRRVLLLPAPRIRRAYHTTPPLRDAVIRAGRLLAARGADVRDAPADLLRDAGDAWFAALQSVGGPSFAELLGDGRRVRLFTELCAAAVGRPRYSWTALFFLAGEVLGRKGERGLERALGRLAAMAHRVAALIGEDGVLILPVHPRVAPHHDTAVLRPFDFLYTAALNALRMPATVVPTGFDADGLPLAVQIAAAHGRDHLTLAAAAAIEQDNAPWRPAGG
jgi:fatty acid amide hydrolase 2